MKGHTVIGSGDVEKIDPPFGKLGATEFLKLGNSCFQPLGYLGFWGYGKKAGLVLVDRFRAVKLALIESSNGSAKVEVLSVMQIACTTPDSDKLPQDLQQKLQEIKRRQEFLQRQLEPLRQQKQ